MATELEVVNDCLATLGAAPLSSLSEYHAYAPIAQRRLAAANTQIQQRGWWFNRESITLTPDPTTSHITLPGGTLKWESGVRNPNTGARSMLKPWLVQRGNRLYDTVRQTYAMVEDVTGDIVREVAFDSLPPVINTYVAALAVMRFQSDFDADRARRDELTVQFKDARMEAMAEDIRQQRINMLRSNPTLARIRRAYSGGYSLRGFR